MYVKIAKWVLALVVGLSVLTSIGLFSLAQYFGNDRVRTLLEQEVSAATGRQLIIKGGLEIEPGLVPLITVNSVQLTNAPWSKERVMLSAASMTSHFDLLSLLSGRIVFSEIALKDVEVLLETDKEGRNNWDLNVNNNEADTLPSPSVTPTDQVRDIVGSFVSITSHFDNVFIDGLKVRYHLDGQLQHDFDISWIGLEAADQDELITLNMTGAGKKDAQTLQMRIDGAADFMDFEGSLGLDVALDTRLWNTKFSGTLKPKAPTTEIDLQLVAKGEDLSALYNDIGDFIALSPWQIEKDKISFALKGVLNGTLRTPSLNKADLLLEGESGDKVKLTGSISKIRPDGEINGKFSATVQDVLRYVKLDSTGEAVKTVLQDSNLGTLSSSGEIKGTLGKPVFKNASAYWGNEEKLEATLTRIDVQSDPITMSATLAVHVRDEALLKALLRSSDHPTANAVADLPLGKPVFTGLLSVDDTGRIGFEDMDLHLGDEENLSLAVNAKISDLRQLNGVEATIHTKTKDGLYLRDFLRALKPDFPLFSVPPLGQITLESTLTRKDDTLDIVNIQLETQGELPLTLNMEAQNDLGLTPFSQGKFSLEGADIIGLRDTVASFLDFEDFSITKALQSLDEKAIPFLLEAGFDARSEEATIKGLELYFANSQLNANIRANNLQERPFIDIKVSDTSLKLAELKRMAGIAEMPASDEITDIFTDAAYDFTGLQNIDFDLTFDGKIPGKGGAVFERVTAELSLRQGTLILHRLKGETLEGTLELGARWAVGAKDIPKMEVDLQLNGLMLGTLLQRMEIADWLQDAPLNATLRGTMQGRSDQELAATFNGQANFSLGAGKLDKTLIDWLGGDLLANVYTRINPFSTSLPYSELKCGEGRLNFKDGISTFEKGIALETKRVALIAGGTIDLAKENLDLSLASSPKEGFGLALGGSGTLVKLTGPLSQPQTTLDEWAISKRGLSVGASILTGGISTLVETVFSNLTRDSNTCATVTSTQ